MNVTGSTPRPHRPPDDQAIANPDDIEGHPNIGPPDKDASGASSGPDTAPGTMAMARRLLDPATEAEIQALAAEAGPMSEDQRATLARLLRLRRPNHRQR
jgi:hypothetical protein